VYLPNGYVDILRPEIVLNSANVYGEKILCFETEPVIELDTMHDFETLVASASAPSSKLQKLMAEKTEFKSSVRGRHIGLVVKDLNRMLNFYREVLGLKVVSHEMEQGSYLDSVLSIPDVRINIAKLVDSSNWMLELLCFPERDAEQRKVLPDTPGYTHVALTVSNAEQMYQRFLDLGLKPLSSPQKNKTGTVKLFFCRDPEGNLMELVQILQT
jgi:catechol 2,3-dioxygenase-like lactoylglutathione lyase family enzyme